MIVLAISPPIPMRMLVAFATLISAVCAAAELPAAVERPEVVIGQSWIYAGYENEKKFSLKFEVEQFSDSEIHAIVIPNGIAALAQLQVFDRQWNHIETFKEGNRLVKFSPHLPAFHFPLHVGKTWAQNYDWERVYLRESKSSPKTSAESQEQKTGGDRKQGSNRAQARVLGLEQVTVPAGTYTAMKVELKSPHYAGRETRRIFGRKELFGGVLETYWYVPTVKRFVKYESSLYVNEKIVRSGGLDLVEYNESPVTSTNGKGRGQKMMPPNAESEYLTTVAVGIGIDRNVTPTEISYSITLKVRKPLPEGTIAVLRFENPDQRAAPVEVLYEPKSDLKEVTVKSPSVGCIVNDRYYRVVVTLFADRERRDILGTHE